MSWLEQRWRRQRSVARLWVAGFSEALEIWTHIALSGYSWTHSKFMLVPVIFSISVLSFSFMASRWMSWFEQRWRRQRSVMSIVNCMVQCTTWKLNAYSSFGLSGVCVRMCDWFLCVCVFKMEDGCVGSKNDEGDSEVWWALWVGGFIQPFESWTHIALSGYSWKHVFSVFSLHVCRVCVCGSGAFFFLVILSFHVFLFLFFFCPWFRVSWFFLPFFLWLLFSFFIDWFRDVVFPCFLGWVCFRVFSSDVDLGWTTHTNTHATRDNKKTSTTSPQERTYTPTEHRHDDKMMNRTQNKRDTESLNTQWHWWTRKKRLDTMMKWCMNPNMRHKTTKCPKCKKKWTAHKMHS